MVNKMIKIFVKYDDEKEEYIAIKAAKIIRKHDDISAVFVRVIQSNEDI